MKHSSRIYKSSLTYILILAMLAAPVVIFPKTRIQGLSDKNAKTVLPISLSTITVTNTNDNGAGSLRQAITDAAPGSTIDFDANVFATPQTITLTSGELVIDKNLAIHGPGANVLSVSGSYGSRVLQISGGVTATLDGITIKDGYLLDNDGGGIYNSGTLTVSNSSIHDNWAYPIGGETTAGGGIFNNGTLTVSNSSIYHNVAYSVEVNYEGSLAKGGGIFSSGALTISNSTISGNFVDAFSDNSGVSGALGGGIYNSGVLRLSNTTIYGNGGYGGGDRGASYGVGIYTISYSILTNTVVAGNSDGCENPCEDDIYGIVNNASHDLIGDQFSSGGIQNGINGNIVGVNPMLGSLQNNGGPTMTHASLAGSPAINAGDNCVLTENGCGGGNPALPTDQRGMPRNGPVDIGAFERQTSEVSSAPFDFDGDEKTDISILRPNASAEWWYQRSSDGLVSAGLFGTSTDIPTPGDFTGDGKTDIAFFRPSTGQWSILRSEDYSFLAFPFGANGDIPMPADYDADGKADAAVFRPSTGTWFIAQSGGGGTVITNFGTSGDQPVAADYDGDGKADIAVYRQNNGAEEWWIQRSSAGLFATVFGASGDKAVPGDYTGDGKTDIAVWRPSNGNWLILRSEDLSYLAFLWGQTGDLPAPGDYDGDGKIDAAVFRPSQSTWFVNRTGGSGPLITNFGTSMDSPLAGVFVR